MVSEVDRGCHAICQVAPLQRARPWTGPPARMVSALLRWLSKSSYESPRALPERLLAATRIRDRSCASLHRTLGFGGLLGSDEPTWGSWDLAGDSRKGRAQQRRRRRYSPLLALKQPTRQTTGRYLARTVIATYQLEWELLSCSSSPRSGQVLLIPILSPNATLQGLTLAWSFQQDTVPVLPNQFETETHEAITIHLNRKYANKVLQQVGFCISVWDLIECGDGKVRWGDGKIWYKGASSRFSVRRGRKLWKGTRLTSSLLTGLWMAHAWSLGALCSAVQPPRLPTLHRRGPRRQGHVVNIRSHKKCVWHSPSSLCVAQLSAV